MQPKWMGPPMAFTKDELQSLNTIMEEKLAAQRAALEQVFDQRVQAIRNEIEQQLATNQQQVLQEVRNEIEQQLAGNQQQILQAVTQNAQEQQALLATTVQQELAHYSTQAQQASEQHQQFYEESVSRSLAAQLLAIEQMVSQRSGQNEEASTTYYTPIPGATPDFDAIEVQTEISWDELVEVIDQRLEERLTTLRTSILTALKDIERYFVSQSQWLRDALSQERRLERDDYSGIESRNMQEVFHSIELLEQLIEAMQVTMTANSALLSKRLYHHQQQPLERAHPTRHPVDNPDFIHTQPHPQPQPQPQSPVHRITEERTP
jgi:hypothetical protein